jgi:ATP-dependent exoDNAse (exonuclease V) beta subunit
MPGLFEIHHLLPEDIVKAPPLPSRYVKALPRYAGTGQLLPPAMTPSETEVTFLPDLDLSTDGSGKRHGTLMHEALAALPNRLWTEADLDAFGLSDSDKARILAFGSSDLYRRALGMEIAHELPFYVEMDGIRMHGAMDFVAVSADQVLLVDYKTDSVSLTEIARRYSDQLNAYRRALEQIYPDHAIEVYAWSLHAGEAVRIEK